MSPVLLLDFHASGKLISWDATDAEIEIDDISWEGFDLCDAGPYTIPAAN